MQCMINAARTSPSRAQRRSARLTLRVRLVIRLGNAPQTDAETVTISRYGAKVRVGAFEQRPISGDQIQICKRGSYVWCAARIAWVDRVAPNYYGIELETGENFWAVHFPAVPGASDDAPDSKRRAQSTTLGGSVPAFTAASVPVTPSLAS